MAKRFHYFDINGLGEGIRYLLHYAEVEFEDVRHDHDTWPKVKAGFPFGQLPVYEEGDRRLHQSLAIARYLGHTHGLAAGDAWQDAQLDAAALTIIDFSNKLTAMVRLQDEEEKAAAKKNFMEETVDFYFSRFDKQLSENNGFFGGKLTWVDFVLVGRIEAFNLFMETCVEAKYPNVQALVARIHSNPGVKKYVATRKPYVNRLRK